MKKISLCIVLVSLFFNNLNAQLHSVGALSGKNPFQTYFNLAYIQNPSIPKGVLEAVAFTQSRFNHIEPSEHGSCIGLPQTYGVMGLVADGKNYFRNNLNLVSKLSGFTVEDIISSPEKNILAYAKAYSVLLKDANAHFDKLSVQKENTNSFSAHTFVLTQLSELPLDENKVNDFALNSHLYSLLSFLNKTEYQSAYNFPQHKIDMEEIFGRENLEILSGSKVIINGDEVENPNGTSYRINNSIQSADYAPALWVAAASCNYSSRSGTAISAVVIHDVEGSYAGCISWFQNCAASVSAHYVLRSSDGQVTQMVLESNKAWHVGSENPYTIGLEHEGYVNQTGWYTTAMYTSSAALVRDICSSGYGINPLRAYNGPSCSGSCVLGSCIKIKGHQHYPNQSHNDPGPNWNWYIYYSLINNTPTVTTMTTASGTFYDSGGPTGNYLNDQRTSTLIQPVGATNITLTFTQFSLENNWDYMYVYNGATTSSPLIGRYTGTSLPGTISGNSALLLDFRSDCATTDSGWAVTYTSNSTGSSGGADIISPTTQSSVSGIWQIQNFNATFTDADNVGGSGLEKSYYQVIDFNGTEWRANYTRGFFADNFDVAINPEWTSKTGTWSVTGQALYQSDTLLSNTNIYAKLNQNLSNRYLYHFIGKIGSLGTNRRAGFHFMCNQPDSINRGDGYFVWFRVDNSQLQIYKVVNNSFGSPVYTSTVTVNSNQFYDYKVIFDRISGLMLVYQNNILISNWTDTSPYTSGNYISFRSGNAKFTIDELKVYRSRAASVNVSVGTGNANDIRYQNPNPSTYSGKIKSICSDTAANLSTIDYNNIDVDWTAPLTIDSVRDGTGADINITNSKTILSANWNPSSDPNSGIAQYWYCIGTTPGDSNTVAWTSNMVADTVTKTGLSLMQGQFYYFTIRAIDGAGLVSIKTSSNGQKVDTLFGTTAIIHSAGFGSNITMYPNPANTVFTINLGTPNGKQNENYEVIITNLVGEEFIHTSNFINGVFKIDVSSIAKGVYFVGISCGADKKVMKLIKD